MIRAATGSGVLCTLLALVAGPFTGAGLGFQSQNACSPNLLAPAPQEVLPQHRLDGNKVESRWRFSWSACPGATRYHLFVIGPDALNPIVDIDTVRTTFHEDRSTHFGITTRQGWSWKVRAFVDGRWNPWSETRTFQVSDILPAQRDAAEGTCSISGRVTGPPSLRFTVLDDQKQPLSFQLTEMLMKTAREPQRTRRAKIQQGTFTFDNLPAGAEYRVFPGNFRSEPPERIVSCQANGRHTAHFRITGPPPTE